MQDRYHLWLRRLAQWSRVGTDIGHNAFDNDRRAPSALSATVGSAFAVRAAGVALAAAAVALAASVVAAVAAAAVALTAAGVAPSCFC